MPSARIFRKFYEQYLVSDHLVYIFFSRAYVAALFIHYAKRWNEPEVATVMLALLVASIVNFRQLTPFLLANLVVILVEIQGFPRLANHSNLVLFIASFLLLHYLWSVVRNNQLSDHLIINGVRGTAVVLYFYVGFHKINTGFLDVATSCATWFHERVEREVFNGLLEFPGWLLTISPWAVIVLEIAAAFFLLFSRWWLLGLLFALPIHLYVSLSGFTDFSSLMHAMMLLFLPPSFWQLLADNPKKQSIFVRSLLVYLLSIVAYGLYSAFAHHTWYVDAVVISNTLGIIYNLALLETVLVIGWIIRTAKPSTSYTCQTKFLYGWPHWKRSHIVFPALIFIWGAFPYLFGSQTSLTMFSNLVTEKQRQNHLLINTHYTKIWDFEADLVFIRDFMSEYRIRTKYDLQGYLLPAVEFSFLSSRLDKSSIHKVAIEIEHNGQRMTIDDLSNSPYAEVPLASNFLTFRQLDLIGQAKCRW